MRVCWLVPLYGFHRRIFIKTNTTHSNTQHTLLSKSSDPSMAQETDPEQVLEILARLGDG